jgi:hypothetical protein
MIRRLAIMTALGAAAAATLVASSVPATPTSGPHVTLAAMTTALPTHGPDPHPHPGPPGPDHGPGWDGRHGNWDGHGGPGHGGGWDGHGGGWDGHHWWVSAERCRAGHGHTARANDHWRGFYCQGGRFNGLPIRF